MAEAVSLYFEFGIALILAGGTFPSTSVLRRRYNQHGINPTEAGATLTAGNSRSRVKFRTPVRPVCVLLKLNRA